MPDQHLRANWPAIGDGTDQPFYYSLTRVFPIAERYFCLLLDQTFPNRRYLISATSLGTINDIIPAMTDYPGMVIDELDAGCEVDELLHPIGVSLPLDGAICQTSRHL